MAKNELKVIRSCMETLTPALARQFEPLSSEAVDVNVDSFILNNGKKYRIGEKNERHDEESLLMRSGEMVMGWFVDPFDLTRARIAVSRLYSGTLMQARPNISRERKFFCVTSELVG